MHYIPVAGGGRGAGTILIADVSSAAARVYAAVCHLAGYATVVCEPDAVRGPLPAGCRPELLVFGHMEGSRARPVLPRALAALPAILISRFSEDSGRAGELKYDAVVLRPVLPSNLLAAIREVLTVRSAQRLAAGADLVNRTDLVHRTAMAEMRRQEHEELRATGAQLIAESRKLREYACRLRLRASSIRTRRG